VRELRVEHVEAQLAARDGAHFQPLPGKGGIKVLNYEHDMRSRAAPAPSTPGPEIFVDGQLVGRGTVCVEVDPGDHEIRNGAGSSPSQLTVPEGSVMVVTVISDYVLPDPPRTTNAAAGAAPVGGDPGPMRTP
jgi:hypothetical protein